MAVYDLEEQEQLDDLRAWWNRWGNLITAAAVAVAIAVVAVQGWRWWKFKQAEDAATLYAAVMTGSRVNEIPKVRDAVTQLEDRYASTAYAPSGALLLARMLLESGDKEGAKTHLQWAIDHGDDEMRQVARYRLAQIQFDAKQYDDALRTLDAKHDESFDGLYADLRGDILTAAGRPADARAAYAIAVAKLDPKSPYRAYVEVKLDAVGGPPSTAAGAAPAAAASAGSTPPQTASASAGAPAAAPAAPSAPPPSTAPSTTPAGAPAAAAPASAPASAPAK